MSDLSPDVGRAHRGAHQDYVSKTDPEDAQVQPSVMMKKTTGKTGQGTRGAHKRQELVNSSQGLKQRDILAFNSKAEKGFVRLISRILQQDGYLSYRDAIREAAFELNISTETAKRYLEKHSARRAEFSIEDGGVTLRKL